MPRASINWHVSLIIIIDCQLISRKFVGARTKTPGSAEHTAIILSNYGILYPYSPRMESPILDGVSRKDSTATYLFECNESV